MEQENTFTVNKLNVETTLPIFWMDLLPISDQLLLARQAINELRISHPEPIQSNVKSVYASPWNSHRLNNKLVPICHSVTEYTRQAVRQHLNNDLLKLNWDLSVTDCWGAIYEENDHTIPHRHFPCDFAAVVYLEAEEGCAPIVFDNKLVVHPKPNMLIVFPGILIHSVPKNTGKRRVVLVMNMNKFPVIVGKVVPTPYEGLEGETKADKTEKAEVDLNSNAAFEEAAE
ncbi:MAG: hypothetical protein HQL46_13375 [Gammaproteobacteria bacterium]|nr:hypothetical protein [Gammaproteobacteria bacterium]